MMDELPYGVAKSLEQKRNPEALSEFLIPLEILPFGESATQTYGAMDLLIAAHSVSLDVVLVTNNVKGFKRVLDLKIENWANIKATES